MWNPALALLALPLLAGPEPTRDEDPAAVGRPAPPFAFRSWIGQPPARTGVSDYRGEVLILHTFAWNCSSCLKVGIPLAVELQEHAGPDDLNVISITTPAMMEDTKRVLGEFGVEHPVALEAPMSNENPYVDISVNPITYMFVLGRSGQVVWRGDPSVDYEECLAGVRRALDDPGDLALDRELHPALGEALAAWFAGDLAKCRKQAASLASRHSRKSRGDSPRIAADAAWLVEHVDAQVVGYTEALGRALEERDALAFLKNLDRLLDSPAEDRAKELLHRAEDDEAFGEALEVAAEWRELWRSRPLVTPGKRDRSLRRWIRDMKGFLADHEASPWHEEARALLETWSEAD